LTRWIFASESTNWCRIGNYQFQTSNTGKRIEARLLCCGAPNNSDQSFEPDRLEVDHIKEGKEGKTMEMSLTITNLQFLTGAQNKAKFFKWKREMRKDK
jgi:hypothetical protein